jgi:hypothetical protein
MVCWRLTRTGSRGRAARPDRGGEELSVHAIDFGNSSVVIRPSFPSVGVMVTIVGDAMTRIYKRQDTITSPLAEAERQTQLVLDADHAGRK